MKMTCLSSHRCLLSVVVRIKEFGPKRFIVRQITGIILANLDFRYIENVFTNFDSQGPLLKETS